MLDGANSFAWFLTCILEARLHQARSEWPPLEMMSRRSLTRCTLVDSTTAMCWTSPFVILEVSGQFCRFYSIFLWKIQSANTVYPDQAPHNVASDLSLHCLPMTFYGFPGKNGLNRIGRKPELLGKSHLALTSSFWQNNQYMRGNHTNKQGDNSSLQKYRKFYMFNNTTSTYFRAFTVQFHCWPPRSGFGAVWPGQEYFLIYWLLWKM